MVESRSWNMQSPLRAAALLLVAIFAMAAMAVAMTGDCAAAERRVALVIGNSAYKNPALAIPNARNDAEDVAAALTALGFDVLLQTDVDLAAASKAIQQFARMSVGADATLFYFAGHAVQYQGHNYLLPIDAEVKDEISLPFETIAVDNIRAVLDRSNGVKIMVLDACRSNPISERLAKLASSSAPVEPGERTRGLERIDRSEGIIVAYATSPGDVALDGQERNSPFTKAFLRRLNEPGLEIEMMFRRIANDVRAATSGRQRPETYVSLVNEYYINQNDRIAWDKIKGTDDPAVLNDFLERFPSSFYAIEAHYRLQTLERAIAEAKERALREAEIARREKELAAEQAAQRLKAEQACASDRAALSAVAPRDADGLRGLAANACDEVKTAAQKRLSDLEATLAAEAAACRRDGDALASLGARDLDGLRALAQSTPCASVKTAAEAKAAAAETVLAKETETCQREAGELKGLIERGDAANLEALRGSAQCPATLAAIPAGLRAIAAAAKAVCDRDGAALAAIPARDAAALRDLVAKTECAPVKATASTRLTDLEALLAREAAQCASEDAELKGLADRNDAARIEALRGRAQCPASVAAADRSLRDIAAAADAACARDNAALNAIAPRDADALRNLTNSTPCAPVKTAAAQRLKDVEAALAHEAELCQRDEAQWKELSPSGSRADVEAFRARAECAPIAAAADRRLAELKTICRDDAAALAAIAPRDAEGLRGFIGKSGCDEVKTAAQDRLAALEASLAHEAELCQRDEAQWKDISAGADGAALTVLRQRVECPGVIAAIDHALADLKTACAREQGALAAIGPNDREAMKAFLAGAVCADVKTAAEAKVAKLEAEEARQEEACRREDVELTALKTQGAEARDKLVEMRRRMSCARLRPDLEAALEQLPPPPVFNSRSQVRSAQAQLQRLGCLAATDSGKLDARTQEGIARYFEAKGDAAPAAEVKVTDEFISRLEAESPSLCTPAALAAPEPSVDRLLRRPKGNVARLPPKEEPRQKALEPRPAKEKAARPAPDEKPARIARPRQPERPQAPAPAQATANRAPAHPASSAPLGVGF
ncbi:conserved exported protein of unknown function [Methylocella tundrae]|uniref:Caspase family p20 domain-containing protein n=2 Tax=Methylocella tundrae TaxID=227605 RepID=A0A4V6IMT5_METTU|nr:conserved exported protein of unknown function [Methylocella tundrae]